MRRTNQRDGRTFAGAGLLSGKNSTQAKLNKIKCKILHLGFKNLYVLKKHVLKVALKKNLIKSWAALAGQISASNRS